MLVNIYLPILVDAFVIGVLPSILATKKILNILSLVTGDYMPFILSIQAFIYGFAVLLVLYFAVLLIFDRNLKNAEANRCRRLDLMPSR